MGLSRWFIGPEIETAAVAYLLLLRVRGLCRILSRSETLDLVMHGTELRNRNIDYRATGEEGG